MEYFDPNYDDVLVVSIRMINARVKKVMIDIGGFANILYFDAFKKLKLLANELIFMIFSLMGFMGNFISRLGTMSLYITFSNKLYSKMVMTNS